MREVLLVRFGEVHLKGLNRPYFLKTLVDDIRKTLGEGRVWLSDGRIYVSDSAEMETAIDKVKNVLGA